MLKEREREVSLTVMAADVALLSMAFAVFWLALTGWLPVLPE